ncbi:hypothetical protein A3Q56_01065 [Intoshia linei]|uniref:EB domain-containing protein n=1 Tax=Intoshia linei TaxID=1819745 RepID=A0A177BCG9_9BILA|nr:hypothetical protein A3Q56_01065 [Intoshia linei]
MNLFCTILLIFIYQIKSIVKPNSTFVLSRESISCDTDMDCPRQSKCQHYLIGCPRGICIALTDFCHGCEEIIYCEDCKCNYPKRKIAENICISMRYRLLGERCGSKQICLQKHENVYSISNTDCNENGICICLPHYNEINGGCYKEKTQQCETHNECDSGFLCDNNECTCPYKIIYQQLKIMCVLNEVTTIKKQGEKCHIDSEMCTEKFTCVSCSKPNDFRCVEYKQDMNSQSYRGKYKKIFFYVLIFIPIIIAAILLILIKLFPFKYYFKQKKLSNVNHYEKENEIHDS